MHPDSAAEIAGRLNPKIGKVDRTPTGVPQYTQEDIAGALGLLKVEKYRLWIHVAYSRHLNFYPQFKESIHNDISERLYSRKPHMVDKLIDCSVLEVLQSPLCPTCNSQKSVLINSKAVTCESCKGSGVVRKSDYWRSSICQVHRQIFKRHWRKQYDDVLDIVRGIDYGAKQALSYRLTV
jgi:hypothetical protein